MLEIKDLRNTVKKQKFYRAVVEDYKDPKKMGRVRVRVVGVHTWETSEVATNTLPWAEVLTDNMFGCNAGVGTSAVPLQGTWCWVFFDNDDYNYPVIFGLITGKAVQPDAGEGFCDPAGKFPYKDRCDEPDMHRLCRVEKLDETIKKPQEDNKDTLEEFISGVIELPELHSKAQYPDCTVQETQSGHHFVVDDTKGNERIFKWHRTGTYSEWKPDGSVQYKVKKDKKETIDGHNEEHIKKYQQTIIEGDYQLHVKGTQSTGGTTGSQRIVNNDSLEYTGGDNGRYISGKERKEVSGQSEQNYGGTLKQKAPTIYLN
jgi:hypothetical protein